MQTIRLDRAATKFPSEQVGLIPTWLGGNELTQASNSLAIAVLHLTGQKSHFQKSPTWGDTALLASVQSSCNLEHNF